MFIFIYIFLISFFLCVFEGTIMVMRILFVWTVLVVSVALVGGDYAPSPQNPFINVTYVPPPPASLPLMASSNESSPTPPPGFTFTIKKLVLLSARCKFSENALEVFGF